MLVIFTTCAILPILAFSAFSFVSTRAQLEEDATSALRRDAKTAAMAITERLEMGTAQLEILPTVDAPGADLRARAFSRIERLSISEIELTPSERHHLSGERPLLRRSDSVRDSSLRLLVRRDDQILIGTFDFDFLFSPRRVGEGERYWITTESDEFLFGVGPDSTGVTVALQTAPVHASPRVPFELDAESGAEIGVIWPLFLKNPYLFSGLRIGMSRSQASIHRPLRSFQQILGASLALALLTSVVVALHQVRIRIGPLESLVQTTSAIANGDLAARTAIDSGDEFEILGASINDMSARLESDFRMIHMLQNMGEALLRTSDVESIAFLAIPAACELSNAVDGRFFVDGDSVGRTVAAPRGIELVGSGGDQDMSADRFHATFVGRARFSTQPELIIRSSRADYEAWDALARSARGPVEALLVIPLISASGRPHGFLQLSFQTEEDAALDLQSRRSLAILGAQTGAALANVNLVSDLRGLFEGVINLTVDAIDEKSPYTGDHCRRVPILAEMITEEVCRDSIGPLKDFVLSAEECYELKIAALLHDCGKVATPVHVMDKATKLENISDRIELVRLRAEILRRDFELSGFREELLLRKIEIPGLGDRASDLSALDDAIAFIERCNIGGEHMRQELRDQVDEIGERFRWVDWNGVSMPLLTSDEVMNLKIDRGTLNDEERAIIDQHVVTTIKLLEQLPFPPELRNVPSIAGAHHEHVDGSGYPNQLGYDRLSVTSRILGLADVFEALTAPDRPYKPGKTLSETLRILGLMVDEGHIDADLYATLLDQNVHLRYAAMHMAPEQIDEAYRSDIEELTAPWNAQSSDSPPI